LEDLALCTQRACDTCVSVCPRKASGGTWYENAYDVVIIGAGVTGCSIARRLSQYKLKVLVLDRAKDVSDGAPKANSGIVHSGYDDKPGTLKAKLSSRGNAMFSQLDSELNFGFRRCGSFVLAFNEQEKEILLQLQENGAKNGVPVQLFDREKVLQMEPNVSPAVVAGLYAPSAGVTSPYEYTIALIENAIANGVQIELEQEVLDITKTEDGSFVVTTNRSHFKSRFVVNCAGLFSDKIAAMVAPGGEAIIRPVKGEYILLNRSQGHLVNSVIFHVPTPKYGKGVLVSRTYWGNLLLGPTARSDFPTDSSNVNTEVLSFIIRTARDLVPGFDVTEAITSYSGLRAKSATGDWTIEECPKAKNFINCIGIDSPGLTASPAVAAMVEELLVKCGAKLLPNPSYNPYRAPVIIPKDKKEFATNLGATICRCEGISEGEIVNSIHRGIPVLSTDAVKKRTRAGMGACQGTYCEPLVAQIISRETGLPITQVARRGPGSSVLPHRKVSREDKDVLSKL